jgi:cytochrome P450
LKEVLRLYPPVWIVSRRAIEDDVICGHAIPAGSVVALSPYSTHRHPRYWDEPEQFRPKRFMPRQAGERHGFAYFPFGGGPRLCIGGAFAMMEAKMVVAAVAQRYRLELVGQSSIYPHALVTLRPEGGLRMKLRPV